MDRSEISQTFALLAREHRVPGAQLAIANGDDVIAFEFGTAEYGTNRTMSRNAKVPIGSITKAFTAALAMVLVSDGDLELDTPVVEYLPELSFSDNHEVADRVTLRHLLSHTSGLPSSVDPSNMRATSVRRRVLDSWLRLTPLTRPGRGFSYSNIGYVLAGHLIEVVTGMSWWEAMASILLQPLGIAPAFVASPAMTPSPPLVVGHAVNRTLHRTRPVQQSLPLVDSPAGGLAMSALDLVTFGRLLCDDAPDNDADLIGPARLREMRQAVPGAEPFGLAHGWGLGLALFRAGESRWMGHDGTADGTSCHLRIDPEHNTVVAVTTNAGTGFAMWDRLSERLARSGLTIGGYRAESDAKPPAPPPLDCAGSYVNGDVEYTVVARDGGELQLVVDGEPFAEFTCYQNLEFEVRDVADEHPQRGRFLRDRHSGRIDMIQLSGRLARRARRTQEFA